MNRLIAIAFTTLMLLAACAPPGPAVRPDRVEDPQRQQIEQLLAEADYRAAALAFIDLAERRPDQASQLYLDAAEAWLSAGEIERAQQTLMRIDAADLTFSEQVRVDLAQAELAMLRGDLATAGWLLAHSTDRLPDALIRRHQALEERLAELESRPIRIAIEALEQAIAEPDFGPEVALTLLIEYPLGDLEEMLFELGNRPDLLPWLDLVISAREFLLDDEALLPALEGWQGRYPQAGYRAEQAQLWISAWRRSVPLPESVTIVLPGPDSPLFRPGTALRDGMLAAWLELMPERRPRLSFDYIDNMPESILGAWFDARERGSDLMVGPLDRAQVNELVTLPEAGLLPTLMLNLPDELENLEHSGALTALALPPEEEAEMAAVHALVTGHQRALVLAQSTGWGERVSRAFVDTFTLGGGRVLQHRTYDPDSADHTEVLTGALQIEESERRIRQLAQVLNQPIEGVAQRRTDVDVIFLAARSNDGRQLRPQLRFFDAGDVPLMATSHIIAGAPEPGRDRDLDGIIVPMSPWFLDFSQAGQVRSQAVRMHDYLDNPALSRLYALGRDAIALVPWLQMMRADPALYLPGMTGRLNLPGGHVVQRDLPFVRIREGHARPE